MKKIYTYLFLLVFTMTVWAGETNWVANEGVPGKTFQTIVSSDDGKKLAAFGATQGYISTSVDSGKTWIARTTSGQRNWRAMSSSADGAKLVAVVFGGNIFTSTDSGANWVERTGAGTRDWISVASSDSGEKIIVVDSTLGYIYTSTDSGVTWSQKTNSGARNWKSVASSADGTKLVAAVKDGYIYTSTNSGGNWTENKTFIGAKSWHAVASSADGTKLVALEYNGHIFTSTDSGKTWIERAEPGNKQWTLATSSADGNKLAVMVPGENIFTSTNGGSTWEGMSISGKKNWQSMAMSADGKKLYLTDIADEYIFSLAPASLSDISSDKVNGTYRPGDTIDIDLTFSEPVSSIGAVTVTLETGTTDRICTFTLTNAKTASCNYLVQVGDVSDDLKVLTVVGTIKDAGGSILNNLTPERNLSDNKNIKIDNTPAVPIKPVIVTKPTTNTPTEPIDEEPLESAPEVVDYGEILYDPETGETYFPEEEIDIEEPELVLESAPETVANVDIPVSYRDIDFSAFRGPGEFSPRQEVISIAVRIHRIELTSNYVCKNIYSDTTGYGVSPWTCQFAERAQAAGLISGSRSTFRPLDSVTRVEAYAILLKSACIVPNITPDNWQIGVIESAMEYGLTVRDIESFAPNRPIQASEVYTIASRVKALLEAHPEMCGD